MSLSVWIILLLKIIDPKSKSTVLGNYAIAYLSESIIDFLIISLIPTLIMAGQINSVIGFSQYAFYECV